MVDYQNIFHWAETQKDGAIKPFKLRKNDPYNYHCGFGNSFESEAIPGTLPHGQNNPRCVRLGLYTETITGSSFTAPKSGNKHVWLYRARPAVVHQGFTSLPDNPDLESNFLPLNSRVHVSVNQQAWYPFEIPNASTDFVHGLRSLAGSGEPTLSEGLATHIYTANTSMTDAAFVNSDGDFLLVPQQGALDIQTEFGKLFVQPGEIAVIPRGVRYRVVLPDGPSRGYILEIWGSHFQLPSLGPLGGNGLANKRDFLYPVAFYDEQETKDWTLIYKQAGKLFKAIQQHSPFDVVAWHGNYLPYKYDLTKFVNVGSISVDHIDPSIFCVLTAPSKDPDSPLADFLIFSPRWDVASFTFRPPYFHRNSASEFMGLIYGKYFGRSESFQPGGASLESSHVAHGVAYPQWKAATERPQTEWRISEGTVAFMFESSRIMTIADYGWKNKGRHEYEPEFWCELVDNFSDQLEAERAARAENVALDTSEAEE